MLYGLVLYFAFSVLLFGLGFNNETAKDILGTHTIAFLFILTNFLDGHSTVVALKNDKNGCLKEQVITTNKAIKRFGLIRGVIIIKFAAISVSLLVFIEDSMSVPLLAWSCMVFCIALNNYRLYFKYCRFFQQ